MMKVLHVMPAIVFQELPSFFCVIVFGTCFWAIYMGVSKNRGVYPPKWTLKIMENPIF